MGTLKEQRGGWVSVAGVKPFHNGDGVCYLDEQGRLQGFRINRVEGNKLFRQATWRAYGRVRRSSATWIRSLNGPWHASRPSGR